MALALGALFALLAFGAAFVGRPLEMLVFGAAGAMFVAIDLLEVER